MSDKVVVFDTERYMIEDGPGIRDAVFFKGCPLRCQWCSNPFGLSVKKQVAYNQRKCGGCGKCISICPNGAIVSVNDGAPETDYSHCTACGACVETCAFRARSMIGKEMTVQEVIDFINPDITYFNRSGGGITLTGGEILNQPKMAVKILKACKDMMIHRAIETSGYGKWDDLKQILSLTNVAFIDLKHIDPKIHQEITGVDNAVILENIRKAAEFCAEKGSPQLIIRLPVIPGINDTRENLEGSTQFIASLEGDLQINLLPFHAMGERKYEMIGEHYQMSETAVPQMEEMKEYQKIIEDCGCRCTIGGGNVQYK